MSYRQFNIHIGSGNSKQRRKQRRALEQEYLKTHKIERTKALLEGRPYPPRTRFHIDLTNSKRYASIAHYKMLLGVLS